MDKCIHCYKQLSCDNYIWCNMKCKESFLLDNYSHAQCIKVFGEEAARKKPLYEAALKRLKDSGLPMSDYLLSLGELKDDCNKINKHR